MYVCMYVWMDIYEAKRDGGPCTNTIIESTSPPFSFSGVKPLHHTHTSTGVRPPHRPLPRPARDAQGLLPLPALPPAAGQVSTRGCLFIGVFHGLVSCCAAGLGLDIYTYS